MGTDAVIHVDLGPGRELRELDAICVGGLGRANGIQSVKGLPIGDASAGCRRDSVSIEAILITLRASQGVCSLLSFEIAEETHFRCSGKTRAPLRATHAPRALTKGSHAS